MARVLLILTHQLPKMLEYRVAVLAFQSQAELPDRGIIRVKGNQAMPESLTNHRALDRSRHESKPTPPTDLAEWDPHG